MECGNDLATEGEAYCTDCLERFHDAAAAEVIGAELVACTLGQRERLELRTDQAGIALARSREAFRRIGRQLAAVAASWRAR